MIKDIATRNDIEFLMTAFYSKALSDPLIGDFFTKISGINLEEHIPEITDFWAQQVFKTGGYKKNVMQIHKDIYIKKKITKKHFDTWLSLFNKTVDDNFKGENAELIKTRALSIATMMQLKLHYPKP